MTRFYDDSDIRDGTVDILEGARRLLAAPGVWLQGHLAVDADGQPVDPGTKSACRWCIAGALHRASLSIRTPLASMSKADGYVLDQIPCDVETIAEWNDARGRTLAEVLATLDAAIADAVTDEAETV